MKKFLAGGLFLALLVGGGATLLALQQGYYGGGYGGYRGYRDNGVEQKDEFAFARLRYPVRMASYGGFGGFGYFRNGGWSEDYPRADRQFVQGVLRLTRIDARPYQEVIDPDSDEIFNWPWLYAVNVADWDFNDEQAKRMRAYLQRGGFLIVDSFHGAAAWESFMIGMRKILPDRPIEDLPKTDIIFHILYDLDEKPQVPGYQYIYTGRTYENDGIYPEWKAIRDENGRIMVAICYNMHIGDAWEHADDPRYPERFSSFAYRMGINYIIYPMTH
jgi:Domain of unknown function (DUF4159)